MANTKRTYRKSEMSKKDSFVNTIITLITLIGVVAFIKHLMSQTDTRLFSEDAVETLEDPKKMMDLENDLGVQN